MGFGDSSNAGIKLTDNEKVNELFKNGEFSTVTPQRTPNFLSSKSDLSEINDWLAISGKSKGYPKMKPDGFVNFDLVFPAFNEESIINFEMSSLLSRESDFFEVAKKRIIETPSNISFPRQREQYIFISLEFNKPSYRFFVPEKGDYLMSAIHGKFPLKKIIKSFRSGKSILSLLNDINFLSSGSSELLAISDSENVNKEDIPINQFNPDSSKIIKAPVMSKDESIFAVSLFKKGKHYLPQDMKMLASSQGMPIKVNSKKENYLILLKTDFGQKNRSNLVKKSLGRNKPNEIFKDPWQVFEDSENSEAPLSIGLRKNSKLKVAMNNFYDVSKMSLSFRPFDGLSSSDPLKKLLPTVSPPKVLGTEVSFVPPKTSNGMRPVGTRVRLVELFVVVNAGLSSVIKKTLWEYNSSKWIASAKISQLVLDSIQPSDRKEYQVEVSFIGHDGSSKNSFTHLTKNFTELSFDSPAGYSVGF